jgi:hypothetical protein
VTSRCEELKIQHPRRVRDVLRSIAPVRIVDRNFAHDDMCQCVCVVPETHTTPGNKMPINVL